MIAGAEMRRAMRDRKGIMREIPMERMRHAMRRDVEAAKRRERDL